MPSSQGELHSKVDSKLVCLTISPRRLNLYTEQVDDEQHYYACCKSDHVFF